MAGALDATPATKATWALVDGYLEGLLVGDDPFQRVLATSAEAGLPPHQVSPTQGKLLMLLAQLAGARHILEIGTLGGYSTMWLARSKPERLVTLEANQRHAAVAAENLRGVEVELIVGHALDTLPKLVGPFDLVFIDADKPNNPDYFRAALSLSRPGTVIVADNVVREGEVIDPHGDANVQGVRRMLEMMAAEPRVDATAIQTVGSKGYDGFAIARVRA
jgi:predicted O-methyltransferase YrrM